MNQTSKCILLLIYFVLITGCTTLPNVKPFAESTATLAANAGTHYSEVSSDIASLKSDIASLEIVKSKKETDSDFETRKKLLETRKKSLDETEAIFKATGKSLNALFSAMITYSEKIASLTAAGKSGSDAAQSILDSVQGFADLANISGYPVSPVTTPITNGFKAIADEFTKMEAKKSLKEAVDSAHSGVTQVAEQFEIIYGKAINQASDGIRNMRHSSASISAGPQIIGFSDNVKQNYNEYYKTLNGFVTKDKDNPLTSTNPWRGFCVKGSGSCQARNELEAVGLVEARMIAIQPIVDEYNKEIELIEKNLMHRKKTSKAVIKAVKAWVLEHQKIRQALDDGITVSAFNLKSALLELNILFTQKP